MQAQGRSSLEQTIHSGTHLAQLLNEADVYYKASNNPQSSAGQRLKAREKTRRRLKIILSKEPDNASAGSLMGRVQMDAGHHDLVQRQYEESLAANPDNAELISDMGYLALITGRSTEAQQLFNRALQKDRQSVAAFCGIAHAKRCLGDYPAAYLHYRRLLDYGYESEAIVTGMAECAKRLDISTSQNKFDPALVQDCVRLLGSNAVNHDKLEYFVSAVLKQHLGLANPERDLALDTAAQDELLLLAMEKCLLVDPTLEQLITLMREAIAGEVQSTLQLRESLQRAALALGLYARRTGYALTLGEEEAFFVRDLNAVIHRSLAGGEALENVAAALIVSAMYGSFAKQSFSTYLELTSITQWPEAMQPLMLASFFQIIEEQKLAKQITGTNDPEPMDVTEHQQPWPVWEAIDSGPVTTLRRELRQELGIELSYQLSPLRILIIGAASGQRALSLARHFNDVDVVAVDESAENLANAARRAEELSLENIVFWPWSLAERFVNTGQQAHYLEIGYLPSVSPSEVDLSRMIQEGVAPEGVIHVNTGRIHAMEDSERIQSLIQSNHLSPAIADIRRLRQHLMSDPDSRLMCQERDFYTASGCRRHWFFPEDRRHITRLLALLGNEMDWRLVRAFDEDNQKLETLPVLQELRAEQSGNGVRGLVGHGLSLYFQRRR